MGDNNVQLVPLQENGDKRNPNGVQKHSYKEPAWRVLLRNQPNSSLSGRQILIATVLLTVLSIIIALLLSWWYFWPAAGDFRNHEINTTASAPITPQKPLLATLRDAQAREPEWGAMRNCLDKAVEELSREPSVVKNNARMVLRCNGTTREFLSGQGENYIEVHSANGKEYYAVNEASPEVRLARLERLTLPLNLTSLTAVLHDVASAEGTEGLQRCLQRVLEEFPREPRIVQDNAKLVLSCGGRILTFVSGEGNSEISVYSEDVQGTVQYKVKATGKAWWSRFFQRGKTER